MNHRERDILIQQLLDGEIPPERFHELQDLLLRDADARKRFYDYVDLHQGLCFSRPAGRGKQRKLGPLLRSVQQRRMIRQTVIAAAAAVVVALFVLQLVPAPEATPPATLRTAAETVFLVTHDPAREKHGQSPRPGTLEIGSTLDLSDGTAELTLASGVTGIVRAPARLIIRGDDKVFLEHGRAWFHVAPEGRGFQVSTRDLQVTDLGTEFGVIADGKTADEVHCFKGKVRAKALKLHAEEQLLTGSQALETNPVGRLVPVALRPEEFLQSLPSGPTYLHWSFDGFDDGLQADGEHPAAGRRISTFIPASSNTRPKLASGRFNQALRFDGKEDHLQAGWMGILGDQSRSVAVWIKVPAGSEQRSNIVGWGRQLPFYETANLKFTLGLSTYKHERGVPAVSFGGTRYYAPGIKVTDGAWHHLACSYRGGPLSEDDPPVTLYVDGRRCSLDLVDNTGLADADGRFEVKTLTRTPIVLGTGLSDSGPRTISDDYRFEGEIDELYLFASPISAETVHKLMTENLPR